MALGLGEGVPLPILGWCLFAATFSPSQAAWLTRKRLDNSGLPGTVKSPLATAYREKPTMSLQIPSYSGRVGQVVRGREGLLAECAEPSVGQSKALRGCPPFE